jgi:hypothetical protein
MTPSIDQWSAMILGIGAVRNLDRYSKKDQ